MDDFLQINLDGELPEGQTHSHENYGYVKRILVQPGGRGQCAVSLYELPPRKSSYPYHYHVKNEEIFFILRGAGLIKTPDGEKNVTAGDFLFFPANEKGAHKLTNTSDSDPLVYIDFDTRNPLDVTFYPDSGKIGVWGENLGRLFKLSQGANYYDGE